MSIPITIKIILDNLKHEIQAAEPLSHEQLQSIKIELNSIADVTDYKGQREVDRLTGRLHRR